MKRCKASRTTERNSGIIHNATVSLSKSLWSVSILYSRFPSSLADTSIPVTNRKKPTPPMQPIRMWRGKKLTSEPSLKIPRRKKTRPVRMELMAYEVMTVARTTFGSAVPVFAMIV